MFSINDVSFMRSRVRPWLYIISFITLAAVCVSGQCVKRNMELVGSLRSDRIQISTTEMGALTVNFIRKAVTVCGSTALVDLGRFFSFLILTESVWIHGLGISPSQSCSLHTEQHKQNKRTQTSMPWVGFEPPSPVFERAKMVHALDRAATVIASSY
jgi:hypothetical protein